MAKISSLAYAHSWLLAILVCHCKLTWILGTIRSRKMKTWATITNRIREMMLGSSSIFLNRIHRDVSLNGGLFSGFC
jgi:hypothetical protein